MNEEKYKIEVGKAQLLLIADCLEDICRFAGGQWELQHTIDEMVKELPFDEQTDRRDKAREHLRKAKQALLPDLSDNASYGYNGTPFIGNTYQIYREILHFIAVEETWNNVYSSPTLKSGNLGTIKIEKL